MAKMIKGMEQQGYILAQMIYYNDFVMESSFEEATPVVKWLSELSPHYKSLFTALVDAKVTALVARTNETTKLGDFDGHAEEIPA